MQEYVLFLDLKDDATLIAQYEQHHQKIWPEVSAHLNNVGVDSMRIYRYHTRLVMLMRVKPDFSFEKMAEAQANNPVLEQWEALMDTYQARLPNSQGKWQLATQIFDLQLNG